MKERYYAQHIGDLKERLRRSVDAAELRELHRLRPWRHATVAGRLLLLYLACAWCLYRFSSPWVWVPIGTLQGINILGFIILLHEQVHDVILLRRSPRLSRALGLLYAFPSALSATQFDRWHNDHHRELGSSETDPKRAHLTPKINQRWMKLLYFTPALFVIYAVAAAREARTYPTALQRRIRGERLLNVALHLAVVAALATLGLDVVWRVWVFPLFICFPPAFVINRIGQHYDIQPGNVAGWSTLVNGNPLVRFLFLNSNHHIEHHYYPAVPLYNLPRLNRLLQPFFAREGVPNRGYLRLLHGWLVKNKKAHTQW